MKIIKHILLVLLSILYLDLQCQTNTEIESSRIYDLSIIQVFPDSFPYVDVLFQARDQNERPLWGIDKSDISVAENGMPSEVIDLINLSESQIIDIAVVLDHSGSMSRPSVPDSLLRLAQWNRQLFDSLILLPKPIDFAKEGVLSFIQSGSLLQDSIIFVGFSSFIDSIVGPTQNVELLRKKINSMEADGGTRFYDALESTLIKMKDKPNQKAAIVALTDGQDNGSSKSVEEVIIRSKEMEIPIYIIGLGNVQDSTLIHLATSTNGLYYKTDNPSQLEEIYLNISRQLKSVYQLRYRSTITGFTDGQETLSFSFTSDTLEFSNPDTRLTLPAEVVSYIHEQEEARLKPIAQRNIMFGGAAVGLAILGLTSFMLYNRKKKKKKLKIKTAYPNPFRDNLHLEIESDSMGAEAFIYVFNGQGQKVAEERISALNNEFVIDLSALPKGTYILKAQNSVGQSDSTRVIKQ